MYHFTINMNTSNKKTSGKTGFASGGVTPRNRDRLCKLDALGFYLSSVLVDSFVLRNPPEGKALKPYEPFFIEQFGQ